MDFLLELLVHDPHSYLVVLLHLWCEDPCPKRHGHLLDVWSIVQLEDGKANPGVIHVLLHFGNILHAHQLLRACQRTGKRCVSNRILQEEDH